MTVGADLKNPAVIKTLGILRQMIENMRENGTAHNICFAYVQEVIPQLCPDPDIASRVSALVEQLEVEMAQEEKTAEANRRVEVGKG